MADGTERDALDRIEADIRAARERCMAAHFAADIADEDVIADGLSLAARLLDDALDEIRRRAV